MSWTRPVDVYLDVRKPGAEASLLAKNGAAFSGSAAPLKWIAGDAFMLRIFLLDPSTVAYEQVDNPAVLVAAKDPADTEHVLFSAQNFSSASEGDAHYVESLLNLNTEDLLSAIDSAPARSGAGKSVSVLVDVEFQNANNSLRSTYRFPVQVFEQMYSDGDLDPSPGPPAYPDPDALLANNSGSVDLVLGSTLMEVDISDYGFGQAPAVVLLTICKPSAGSAQLFAVVEDVRAESFTAHFSAAVPEDGYKLHYLVIT